MALNQTEFDSLVESTKSLKTKGQVLEFISNNLVKKSKKNTLINAFEGSPGRDLAASIHVIDPKKKEKKYQIVLSEQDSKQADDSVKKNRGKKYG